MNDYVIVTDGGCDIDGKTLEDWGVRYCSLTYRFGDGEELTEGEMPPQVFYDRMRNGEMSKTSAVNMNDFLALFGEEMQKGRDILYLGFSSGLSCTCNSAMMAARELKEDYPDRTIITIDTLSASAGEGLLVYMAVLKKNEGVSLEDNAVYITENIHRVAHWFTVEDLVYLKRGGRISAASALAGGVLGIKPVLHMDDSGHLINVIKAHGRCKAIKALADKYTETALDPQNGIYFISHGDCLEEAKKLENMIYQANGKECDRFVYIGSVIGSHSGPGTIALFYLAKER